MRHGETMFNVQHKIQGWCDSPLTEKESNKLKMSVNILKNIILSLIMRIVLLAKDVAIL